MKTSVKISAVFIIGLIIGVAAGYGITAFVVAPRPPEVVEYTIGVPVDLSGAGASFGIPIRDAITIALDEVNDLLEKSGSNVRLKLSIVDSKTTPDGALEAIQSLAAGGVKIVVGMLWSGQVAAISSYVNEHKIFTVAILSTAPELGVPDYIFRAAPSDVLQGKALNDLAWREGYKKVAILYREDPVGIGLEKVISEEFKRKGGTVKSFSYTGDLPDYSAEMAKLSSMVSELGETETAVIAVVFDYESVIMFDRARLDPVLTKVRWFGPENLRSFSIVPPKASDAIGEFLTKVHFTGTSTAPPEETPIKMKFEDTYRAKTGREPETQVWQAYDAMWSTALALISIEAYDADAMKMVYPQIAARYTGATGNMLLDENGDKAIQDYSVWVVDVKEGEYTFNVVGYWDYETREVVYL